MQKVYLSPFGFQYNTMIKITETLSLFKTYHHMVLEGTKLNHHMVLTTRKSVVRTIWWFNLVPLSTIVISTNHLLVLNRYGWCYLSLNFTIVLYFNKAINLSLFNLQWKRWFFWFQRYQILIFAKITTCHLCELTGK